MTLWILAPALLVLGSLAAALLVRRIDAANAALQAQLLRVDDVDRATRALRHGSRGLADRRDHLG